MVELCFAFADSDRHWLQLLGFTLPPRAPQPPTHLPRRSNRRNTNHAVFDRARFVHQFRFVVKPDKGESPRPFAEGLTRSFQKQSLISNWTATDYTAHVADPDIHLEWPDVLQVILPTSASALASVSTAKLDQSVGAEGGSVPACPICLSEPVAPRMVSLRQVRRHCLEQS